MESLFFEDFEIGREYVTRGRTVTEGDTVAFAGLSGDFNPLHTDAEYARNTIFGERIAHGLLGLSIASGLMTQTVTLEQTVIAFLQLTWNFKAAIKFGDTITVRMRVAEKRETSKPDRGVMRWGVAVINQRGEIVQEGEQTVMLKRRLA